MAETSLTAVDCTRYWEAERKMLLEATGNVLPKYLLHKGWEIGEQIKTSYQTPDGQKYKTSTKLLKEEDVNNPKANWTGRSFKAKKVVNGVNQFVSLSMSKNNFMLWVDYNKNPRLEITQPPRQFFLYAMMAEQKFMQERLHLLPKQWQDFVKPFTTAKLNVDTLAADYHQLEPMRQIAIKHFGPELSRTMDFHANIKLRYLAKNPALGQAEKPGGSIISLMNPSDETVKLRALEMAKVKPDKSMLLWLNRRENVEVLRQYRLIADSIGDKEKINGFYELRKLTKELVDKKENEIIDGTDVLFKDSTTCQDIAHEYGFRYQRSTNEREFYIHNSSPSGEVIVSMPKINPYVYRNHSNSQLVGGNVNSFRQEFKSLKPNFKTPTPEVTQTSALPEMNTIAAKHKLALSPEDLKAAPDQKANQQLEINLSPFQKSLP